MKRSAKYVAIAYSRFSDMPNSYMLLCWLFSAVTLCTIDAYFTPLAPNDIL